MRHIFIFCLLLLLCGCAATAPTPIKVVIDPAVSTDYLRDVKPILDKRCVCCHSCYNSPCQLKLSSFEGVDRGGSKIPVYDGSRLRAQDPTRLFIDAKSTEEWRNKGFFSVTKNTAQADNNDSIMIHLLAHKMKNPLSIGDYFPEASDLSCSENSIEVGEYLEKHPNGGMPFGFPALTDKEFQTVAQWLQTGAKGPTGAEQAKLNSPSAAAYAEIKKWELFLNNQDPKHSVTARYLYEHLFLAHINFNNNPEEFFELVRSTTPPGETPYVIDTIRPYDDPGVETFYYRFSKVHSTIVHKTHMVFKFNDQTMARFKELFIAPQWDEKPHKISFDPKLSANPFVAYMQIPPRSRYQFLLDNAHYILMTFIRGPVCKGQIALNVIHDHFWVMFMDPASDLSVIYPGFLRQYTDELAMPIEKGSDISVWKSFSNEYNKKAVNFLRKRDQFYKIIYPHGLGYDSIWPGDKATDAPLLTVYRHFDSASVHKGALGDLPRTMWVIDYPILERIYYSLVAGFDVFGNVGHQANIRRYMNNLRINGESNFINLMPQESRLDFVADWYKGLNKKTFADVEIFKIPTNISYFSDNYKKEFIEHLIHQRINPVTGITFDPLNYKINGETQATPPLPETYKTPSDYVQALQALNTSGANFVTHITDHYANLGYLRIKIPNKKDIVFSIVVNRWHDNVAFMFDESSRLKPNKDKADFIPGFVGSFPNIFIEVDLADVPEFFKLLQNFERTDEKMAQLNKYLVNRANSEFWQSFDWMQKRFYEDDPMQAGLFDLNRYLPKAVPQAKDLEKAAQN